jgi:hypothetical protein
MVPAQSEVVGGAQFAGKRVHEFVGIEAALTAASGADYKAFPAESFFFPITLDRFKSGSARTMRSVAAAAWRGFSHVSINAKLA